MSRVYVIDDDEQLGRSISRILQREGHDCRILEDFAAARASFDVFAPDLVVVEIQPEWMSELCDFRSSLDRTAGRTVPFIFTVGRRELFRPIGALARPGDDWTGKPLDPEEFAIRVARAVRPTAH